MGQERSKSYLSILCIERDIANLISNQLVVDQKRIGTLLKYKIIILLVNYVFSL